MPTVQQFSQSDQQEPHRRRTKDLLRAHPDIRLNIGKNPFTFLFIVICVGLQVGMAFLLRAGTWWEVLLVAFFFGAYVSHALWTLIHECAHNLIFARPYPNTLAAILANLPHLLPSAVSFQRYHLKHHAFQGVYDLDADLPSRWEARLVGSSAIRKALWLILFPIFQVARPPRLKEIRPIDSKVLLNIFIQLAFDVSVYVFLGPTAFLYLLVSFFFSVGLHPLGARWIQEHYMVSPPQETYSYYGPLNRLAFNVGYHNEHHDLPSVPWNHLPRIREAAPEFYNSIDYHTSWTRLLFQFIFDPKISLFSRAVRVDRGKLRLDDAVKPDIEFLESTR